MPPLRRTKTRWRTTAIPEDLYQHIKKVVERHGYTGISDFVKDACRRRIEQLEPVQLREVHP
jgi:metal-responsive CopG/Arc/MetJ family transcriptional regulator